MIYPLLPLFLSDVLHAPRTFIGAVEGAAEATASLLKLVSGRITDRLARRKPLDRARLRPVVAGAPARRPRHAAVARARHARRRSLRQGHPLEPARRAPRRRHRSPPSAAAPTASTRRWTTPARSSARWSPPRCSPSASSMRSVFLLAAIPGALAMAALVFGVREVRERRRRHAAAAAEPRVAAYAVRPTLRRYLVVRRALRPRQLLRRVSPAARAAVRRRRAAGSRSCGWRTTAPRRRSRPGAARSPIASAAAASSSPAGRSTPSPISRSASPRTPGRSGRSSSSTASTTRSSRAPRRRSSPTSMPAGARGRAFGWFNAVVGVAALPASLGFGALADRFGARVAFTASAALAAGGEPGAGLGSLRRVAGARRPGVAAAGSLMSICGSSSMRGITTTSMRRFERAALGGVVVGERIELRVARRRQPPRVDALRPAGSARP